MRRGWGRVGGPVLGGVALALAACSPDLPASVEPGSTARVGWSSSVTSLNAATSDGDTPGNREVAAATRGQFARLADGEVVLDESFGDVEVLDPAAASFTVRYDLAGRHWSDGIPVDAADLLLAWAAGSGAVTDEAFDAAPTDLAHSTEVPEVDEFERRIDVAFTRPVRDWRTALDVAVPAHVVGRIALGVDDAMEAKQAVITAIRERDPDDLAAIAEAWNDGFDLEDGGDLTEGLRVSSGPYRVVEVGDGGRHVRLDVNREYDGEPAPAYEHVELVTGSPTEQLGALGEDLDVAQVAPTVENRELVRGLERRDHEVTTSHDGRLWALVLRTDRGVFTDREARRAFLRTVPRSDLRTAGAGRWAQAYAASDSLLFGPGSEGYDVALEDAGLRQALGGGSSTDAAFERRRAGVPAGTAVCVLHDRAEPFATGAVAALRSALAEAEAGWRVRDCGTDDLRRAVQRDRGWHAVLTTVPLPEAPREVAAAWGSRDPSVPTGSGGRQRDRLVRELARTPDPYDARDLRVAIEAQLVDRALALPLAVDPEVTVASRGIENVRTPSGRSATLLAGVADWGPGD